MTSDADLRAMIRAAIGQGAVIRVVLTRDEKAISRVLIRRGVPGVRSEWMPPIQAAERLREFLAACEVA